MTRLPTRWVIRTAGPAGTRPRTHPRPRWVRAGLAAAALAGLTVATVGTAASAASSTAADGRPVPGFGGPEAECPPRGTAIGFSDALNKVVVDGETVGGLSGLAYDARRHAYAAVVDRSGTRPARIWFLSETARPTVVGSIVLRTSTGVGYDGGNFDGEGLAVLPDGRYVVSSETEPSIRIFDRTGTEQSALPVPGRFRVAPAGEATDNATLEGLSISPSGRFIYAAMEGTLAGDVSAAGEAQTRRILVYRRTATGSYELSRQLGYRAEPGQRISEIAAYGEDGLLVLEASFTAGVGNRNALWAVPDTGRTADVTAVPNLSALPARALAGKQLVADLTACPTLGATNPGTQINPLMDNYEALAIDPRGRFGRGLTTVSVLSDDNFGATQVTRLLRVAVRLP
ncbi:esterase-like activity of phytase family protein [Frankia sp. CcI49]|uniref:esterase-like activity of phytase family protein n=1 Tax=Frankia sp. CcI49 TaxID=1745382 RepID=UPI000A037E85|nr:esterase-like activity of phytase family protein [Frankia sp. CcI49]